MFELFGNFFNIFVMLYEKYLIVLFINGILFLILSLYLFIRFFNLLNGLILLYFLLLIIIFFFFEINFLYGFNLINEYFESNIFFFELFKKILYVLFLKMLYV